ncbi:uncharacterized protein HRG_11821 [Hirsutella rhossiliensis]|uniref:Retroviral polymerase SH3-like domain-containing protein n=1 Tax=Hirsutella rhossiliensis TaxID=111463 RepID=A0A9P8ML09_9HYPO|nr:uncharacterized protein HRG_11821 [Hirsutella rhossiliensis]KAH0957272.1 hypothetical protein HRG_11821 [Hirsutella rhossiliensis]
MDRWFHQHFRWYRPPNVDFDANKDLRPDWRGVCVWMQSISLNSRYKARKDINQFKLGPRAHVGYFVGYHASNIYRIWVPKLNQVILSRDVRFNEEEFFDPEKEEQLETEAIAEYKPTSQALDPLPQRDWDTLLDEFLYEFDHHILGFDLEGSNSGVEDARGAISDVKDAGSQLLQPLSQDRLHASERIPGPSDAGTNTTAGQKGRLTSFQVNGLKDFNTRPTVANRPELTCPTFCGWFKQRSN